MVVRARCAGVLYFENLSWFPIFDNIKDMEHMGDGKLIEVCVYQKLS